MGSINGSLDLMGRHRILENTLYKNEAEGNPVSFKTNVTKNLKECVVELSPKQDLNGYDHPWVGGTGKNLLDPSKKVNTRSTLTEIKNGFRFVATNVSYPGLNYYPTGLALNGVIEAGKSYTVSFTVSGTKTHILGVGLRTVAANIFRGNTVNVPIADSGSYSFSFAADYYTEEMYLSFCLLATANDTGSCDLNITNIMLEEGTTATTFAPYSNICPIDSWGGKNLLKYPYRYGTTTLNGVTFANNGDGTITVNGTATADTNYFMHAVGDISLSGTYILSGCPSGGSDTTYYLAPRVDTSWLKANRDYGDGATLSGTIDAMAITVANGCVCNNLIFKPMLRLASSQDPTWQPYRKIENIITHTGKNLIPWPELDKTSVSGVTASIVDDELVLKGTATGNIGTFFSANKTNIYDQMPYGLFSAGTYSVISYGFVGQDTSDRIVFTARYDDGTIITNTNQRISAPGDVIPDGSGRLITFTATKPFKASVWVYVNSGTTINCSCKLIMVSGTDVGTYEPYNPTQEQYTVTWENDIGEVFGGSLNLTTGEMVSEVGICTVDADRWVKSQRYDHIYQTTSSTNNKPWTTENVKCNALPIDNSGNLVSFGTKDKVFRYTDYIYVVNQDIDTIEDFRTWAQSINLTFTYPLATPITYHLNPVQIKTLLETNVLTTDGDNIRVTYWKH